MDIKNVSCVGAGLIGHGWATLFAANGFEVFLYDLTEDILKRAVNRIATNLNFLEGHNLLEHGVTKAALKRIKMTTSLVEAVSTADYVQESVPDNYDIKKQIFKELDAATPEHAILASSASGLLMTPIQKVTVRPERCVLAHPMLPVHLIPLVEVVGGELTSQNTVKATSEFLLKIGKTPVVLNKEVPGYIVNRFQAAVLREAIDLVDKGIVSVEAIDTAFCKGIGLRDPIIGPFLRIHLAGDGIERFIENYSQSYSYRWESMETWTSIPPSAAKKVINEANAMDAVRSQTLEDLKRWRDEKLVELLKVLRDD